MTFQYVHCTIVHPQDALHCGDCRLCFGDLADKIPALFPSAHWETDACFDENGRTFRCPECIEAELVAREPTRVLRRCGLCGGRGYLQEGPDGTGSPGGCFAVCPGCTGQGNPPGWALVPLKGHVAVPNKES